ncbi:hypothetical protein B9T31_17335 [Acinetobacter sp. ANC 4558]|uniref:hypothetical protein n=1 Tax=Acinetobacter sp. ANC 4558 TaxID=1977876 RepID=UPI000A353A2F|nr:hypothetical protein [Acinetobacter sp. ANC 4558]OTG79062.1 hypothetical protein B9T31_17335 [Acinetobacter sp. ANC 4558]
MGWTGKKPTEFAIQVLKDGDEHLRRVSGEMLQAVILGSPVMDGTYRANHRVSVDSPSYETVQGDNKAPKGTLDQATFNDGAKEIAKAHIGSCVYIQNNLSYGIAIENGHSGQAPEGVYALAFQLISEKYK